MDKEEFLVLNKLKLMYTAFPPILNIFLNLSSVSEGKMTANRASKVSLVSDFSFLLDWEFGLFEIVEFKIFTI